MRLQHQHPGRRRRVAIAVAAISVLVAGGTGALVWADHRAGRPIATEPGRQAGAPVSPLARSAPRGRPASGATLTPAVSLAALQWKAFYGVELPASASAGPRHRHNGLAWGFADSPLGALVAAMNIGVRANAQWGPGIFGPTIRRQVVGPAKAALLAACQASYEQERRTAGVADGQPLGRAYVTEEAFRWVSYTPAAATIDLVSAGPGNDGATARAVTQISLTWSGTDWQVIAPLGGDWGNSAAPLTSLDGYTVFPLPPA